MRISFWPKQNPNVRTPAMLRIVRVLGAIAAVVTVATTGCGGGGGSDAAPAGPPPPNPLYVRTSGNDTNSGGDPANALRTISKAAQLARNGYVILVGPGTYGGGITTARTGVAPQGLSFVANVAGDQTDDNPGPVTINNSGSAATAGFNLSSAPGSLIDGFTITGFSDAGIVIKSGSDNFMILNCIVANNPGDGIRVQDSSNVLVFNNLVTGNGGTGIGIVGQISGSPDAQVLSNTIAGNGAAAPAARGIIVGNSNAASPRAVVHNNIVQGNSGDAQIRVLTTPRSDLGYDGDYNLVFPAKYLPTSIRGSHDFNGDAQFTGDFHLRSTSPAIDRGGPLNLPDSLVIPSLRANRTTTGTNLDSGVLDMGFHFLRR
jgi:parallel beta-helix repeat protein